MSKSATTVWTAEARLDIVDAIADEMLQAADTRYKVFNGEQIAYWVSRFKAIIHFSEEDLEIEKNIKLITGRR